MAKECLQPRRVAVAKQPKRVSSDESDSDGVESEDIIFVKTEPAPRGRAVKLRRLSHYALWLERWVQYLSSSYFLLANSHPFLVR